MSVPRFWRFNRKRYMLTGTQCANCGERFLAPRLVCPQCHNEIEQVAQDVFPTLSVKKEETGVFPETPVSLPFPLSTAKRFKDRIATGSS